MSQKNRVLRTLLAVALLRAERAEDARKFAEERSWSLLDQYMFEWWREHTPPAANVAYPGAEATWDLWLEDVEATEAALALERERTRILLDAVRFYADEEHWLDGCAGWWCPDPCDGVPDFQYDEGEEARNALEAAGFPIPERAATTGDRPGDERMGYPMNYQRVIRRNHLTGGYDVPLADITTLNSVAIARAAIAGDLRRLEQDQRDEAHLQAYAQLAGITLEQARAVLDAFFDATVNAASDGEAWAQHSHTERQGETNEH